MFAAHIIQELLGFGVTSEGLHLPHLTVVIDCLLFRAYKKNTLKHHSVYEIMLPLVSPVLLFALCTSWIFVSPMDILEVHPRLFYFMVGTAFANISVSGFALCFSLAPGKSETSLEEVEHSFNERKEGRCEVLTCDSCAVLLCLKERAAKQAGPGVCKYHRPWCYSSQLLRNYRNNCVCLCTLFLGDKIKMGGAEAFVQV